MKTVKNANKTSMRWIHRQNALECGDWFLFQVYSLFSRPESAHDHVVFLSVEGILLCWLKEKRLIIKKKEFLK